MNTMSCTSLARFCCAAVCIWLAGCETLPGADVHPTTVAAGIVSSNCQTVRQEFTRLKIGHGKLVPDSPVHGKCVSSSHTKARREWFIFPVTPLDLWSCCVISNAWRQVTSAASRAPTKSSRRCWYDVGRRGLPAECWQMFAKPSFFLTPQTKPRSLSMDDRN